MNQPTILEEVPDFSLVLGGPLFQLYRRTHLSGSALELVHRRIIVTTLITWLPLLILSSLDGHLRSGVRLPFLYDIETQVRFLIALPILIAAELVVNALLPAVVRNFVNRKIVMAAEMSKFRAIIDSGLRLRNSIFLELGLLIFVFISGHWLRQSQIALGTSSWYAIPGGEHIHLTRAGNWDAFVSLPIFRFILLRWYLRLLIWFRFLWQVSRLNLYLVSTHPDQTAGLAFLGTTSYGFAPVLFAQGTVVAGLIASRVLYGGERLLSFKMQAVGLVGFFVLFILGPLTMFTPQLERAKRKGLADYGSLGSDYVEEFQQKWVIRNASRRDDILGAQDIQSLADLGTSYEVVRGMRLLPFGLQDIMILAAAAAAPLVPLGLTVLSLEDLVIRLLKIIF